MVRLYNADIESNPKEKEKKMIHVSDCCNVPSDVDHEVCSRCGEHCEIITDDSCDYIPGLDDGEGYDPIMGDDDEWIDTDDEWLDDFQGEEDFA